MGSLSVLKAIVCFAILLLVVSAKARSKEGVGGQNRVLNPETITTAQAGSAGGGVGRDKKDLSGGTQTPNVKRSAPKRRGFILNGTWRLNYTCFPGGKYIVMATFRHSSASRFTGSTIGVTSGCNTRIVDGRISGNIVRFKRKVIGCLGGTRTVRAELSGGGRILKGKDPYLLGSCSFIGRKK